MSTLHVVLRVGDAEYVVPATDVVQMETWTGATHVPGAPPWVLGVAQLRGALVPVVDLRSRFRLPERSPTPDDRVVVLKHRDGLVGLKVDRAREVLWLEREAFQEPPELVLRGTTPSRRGTPPSPPGSTAVAEVPPGRSGGSHGWVKAVVKVDDRLLMELDLDRVVGEGGADGG